MGHHITGLVLATPWHEAVRSRFDLVAAPLCGVTMFHIDHFYAAYWRATLEWPGTSNVHRVRRPFFPTRLCWRTSPAS